MRKTFAIASNSFMYRSPLLRRSSLADHLGAAAGGLNLLHRGLRKQVSRDVNGALELAPGQHLQTRAQLPHHAQLHQTVGTERVAFETFEMAEVHDGVLFLENISKSTLRQTAVQRHLAAFKSAHDAVAG